MRARGYSFFVYSSVSSQDYKENMLAHQENRHYAEWDLETTTRHLSHRFPNAHVWTVKPAKMLSGIFSIYSNFIRWQELPNGYVSPVFEEGQRSWHHLCSLIQNAVHLMNYNELARNQVFSTQLPLFLIGFSKGCTVLNQLVYDLPAAAEDNKTSWPADTDSPEHFIDLIKAFYWLDGGHSGGSDAWITQDYLLRRLERFEVHSHVTPYQVNDKSRPWIGVENKQFVAGLEKYNANVKHILHFDNEPRSLLRHFDILNHF
jgi:Uncharacterised protein family UPF0565